MYKNLKNGFTSRLFASALIVINSEKKTYWKRWLITCCNIFNTTHSALSCHTLPKKAREQGRSMIEMLGVLAIIGVLSVSGIAGYSKAMEKYKVNKAIDEYTYLIYGLLEHLDEIKYSTKLGDGKITPIVKLANDLNLVPSTWSMKENNLDTNQKNLFEDPYNNIIAIYSRNGNLRFDFVLGGSQFPDDSSWITENFSTKFCTELVSNVVKPLHSSLELLFFYRSAGNSSTFYGDKNCSAGRKCLNNISISEIHDNCELCSRKEVCSVTIDF